ncbi:MAG: lytic murein transglycosylase [Alphaproteobacteria bacterium]|nr:lytic murein transglycosylase [Alphaproteobacteria bacterium]
MRRRYCLLALLIMTFFYGHLHAEECIFNSERWDAVLADVRARATAQGISDETINATLRNPAFIPSIVKSDRNQSEFKLTLNEYLNKTVNSVRVVRGRQMREKYPTMLSRVDNTYGLPPHVILAFWGMESNYGEVKSRHRLVDAFITLMYDGRREKFFGEQLLALMKIADANQLDINNIRGSWAGAMGHFQFIPTTLVTYGVDGNNDGQIDIINSVGDAMASAGNYLNKLGWNKSERIVRRVILPADFDTSLLDGKTKKTLTEWAGMGVLNPDNTAIPTGNMVAGLVADVANIGTASPDDFNPDTDVAPRPVITAYLTYPNFYRIKRWNNSNWYAIAIAELADKLK